MALSDSLDATIAALDPEEIDAAAVELARIYARQLDQAAAIQARADKALRSAEKGGDEALIEQMAALRAKLGERECVDRIGARFHALLADLQAVPKARNGAKPGKSGSGTLHKLRAAK